MASYTPVTIGTDGWKNPMHEKLYQVWAETRNSKELVAVSPKIGKQQAENFYEIYREQIRKGVEREYGAVYLHEVPDDRPKLILPSDPNMSIEHLKHKFSQERQQMNYNRSNPFWR